MKLAKIANAGRINLNWSISMESYNTLKDIKRLGHIELRDSMDKKGWSLHKSQTRNISIPEAEALYDARNYPNDIDELLKYDLIEADEMAWHLTYKISDEGLKLIETIG